MSSKSIVREIIFFVLIFLLFYLGGKLANFWQNRTGIKEDISLLVVGLGVIGIMVGVFYLAKMNQHADGYRNLQLSPGALCRGGGYMFQGDNAQAKFCQQLESTPEGKCEISKFNCPNGYDGIPKVPLEFTPNSDSYWSGVRCKNNQVNNKWYAKHFPKIDHGEHCKCHLCSLWTNQYDNTCS